jgi:hypothetical protein
VNGKRTWPDRVARWWVSAYTRGLRPEVQGRRREEIASDIWEHQEHARDLGEQPAVTSRAVLTRIVAGVPADLFWRIEMKKQERWRNIADRELAAQYQHDVIGPLAFVLQALRPRVQRWSEGRPAESNENEELPPALGAAAQVFEVPSLPPFLCEWLGNEGHLFLEAFPFHGSEADAKAYDDALRSASIRLKTQCPRPRNGNRLGRRSRSRLEARLRGVGLDVRGPDGGEQVADCLKP